MSFLLTSNITSNPVCKELECLSSGDKQIISLSRRKQCVTYSHIIHITHYKKISYQNIVPWCSPPGPLMITKLCYAVMRNAWAHHHLTKTVLPVHQSVIMVDLLGSV